MRLSGTRTSSIHQYRGLGDQLWDLGGARPTLDLNFAHNKSLVDSTIGQSLITFTRASSGTYVDSAGVIQTATTDVPRFDHDPTTGESLGLLIEESRTNLLLRSEAFGDASWLTNATSASVLSDQVNSPAGTLTVDLLRANNGISISPTLASSFIRQDVSKAASVITYTLSCYAKGFGHDGMRMLVRDGASGSNIAYAFYRLSGSGTISDTFVGGTFSSLATQIQLLTNGWYRCQLTFTTGTETTLRVLLLDSNSSSITANGVDGVYVWGAQLEAGSFATSYIPTTSATVTRAADVATITGSNFSSWYNQTEGTVFADSYRATDIPGSDFPGVFYASDGTVSNRVLLSYMTNTTSAQIVTVGGVQQAGHYPAGLSGVLRRRTAAASKLNGFYVITNGDTGNAKSDASGTMPTLNQLNIGSSVTLSRTNALNGTIRRLTYWPTRLSDTTLQKITQ